MTGVQTCALPILYKRTPSVQTYTTASVQTYPSGSVQTYTYKRNNTKETITKEISEQSSQKTMKKNKMGKYNENNNSDSYEEVIDFDSGTVIEEIKPEKIPIKEIYALFGKYPANWVVNKSQRIATENLYKERGLKKIKSALRFYRENKDTEFCPTILSPWDLDSKWDRLLNFKKKQQ